PPRRLAIRVAITSTPCDLTATPPAGPAQFPATVAPSPRTCSTSSAAISSTGRSAATAATVAANGHQRRAPPWCRVARPPVAEAVSRLPGYSFGLPQFDRVFEGVERMMSDAGERMLAAQEGVSAARLQWPGLQPCLGVRLPQRWAVSESRAAGPGECPGERIAVGHHIAAAGTTRFERSGRNSRARASSRRTITMMALTRARGQQFDPREWTGVAARIAFKGRRRRRRPPRRVALGTIGPSRGRQALKVNHKTVRHLLNLRVSDGLKIPLCLLSFSSIHVNINISLQYYFLLKIKIVGLADFRFFVHFPFGSLNIDTISRTHQKELLIWTSTAGA
uniref:Os01g0705300 protein n=1 Tax=Macrostomum lignano TaxID=282301 RepID=A0A1I8FAE6_9PLAT